MPSIKMTFGKKLISICILLLALLPAAGVSAQNAAAGITESGLWTYTENDTGLTLTEYRGDESVIRVPSYIGDKPVTQLVKELFMANRTVTEIIIPDQISVIGDNAFYGCTALTKVTLPNSLKRLAPGSFRYCTSLMYIELPYNLTSIGKQAFADCPQLREIVIPPKVTSIEESAFENCTALGRIVSMRRVSNVGGNAFRNTEWLDQQTDEFVYFGKGILVKWNGTGPKAVIPYGATLISSAFEGNTELEEVLIPDSVKQIGQYSFKGAVNLKTVSLPAYLTTINQEAFADCLSLQEIRLPDTVTSIGQAAFQNCTSLKAITIPAKVKSLGASVLGNCSALRDILLLNTQIKIDKKAFAGSDRIRIHAVYDSAAAQFAETNGIPFICAEQKEGDFLYIKDREGVTVTGYTGSASDIEIPSFIGETLVTKIGAGAFQNNRTLRTVILPPSVKAIGNHAFAFMQNLSFVQMPAGIKQIGANAFTGSQRLSEIRLPRRLTEIGMDPFDHDRDISICAQPDSIAEKILSDMGYAVIPYDSCSPEPTRSFDNSCICPEPVVTSDQTSLVVIPEGLTTLSAELLDGFEGDLILIVPSDTEEIDPAILSGRKITLISESGSAAEQFAEENGIRFIVYSDAMPDLP